MTTKKCLSQKKQKSQDRFKRALKNLSNSFMSKNNAHM